MKYITIITFLIASIIAHGKVDSELLAWVKASTTEVSVITKSKSDQLEMTREWIKLADELANKFPPSKERTRFLMFFQTRAFKVASHDNKIGVIKIFLNQIDFLDGDTSILRDYWTPKLLALQSVGQSLSDRTFSTISGEDFKVADYKGKVIILDLFATWCKPCVKFTPTLQKLKTQYKDQLEILVISLDTNKVALTRYFADKPEFHVNFLKSSFNNPLYLEFGVGGIPSMVLINKDGNVVDLHGRENITEKVKHLINNNIFVRHQPLN